MPLAKKFKGGADKKTPPQRFFSSPYLVWISSLNLFLIIYWKQKLGAHFIKRPFDRYKRLNNKHPQKTAQLNKSFQLRRSIRAIGCSRCRWPLLPLNIGSWLTRLILRSNLTLWSWLTSLWCIWIHWTRRVWIVTCWSAWLTGSML